MCRPNQPPCAQCVRNGADPSFWEWVGQMVLQHRAAMARTARREGVLAEDALDCVQEAFHTFLLLPQARELVNQPRDCARLLTTLSRNAARNRRRRHHNARPHLTEDTVLHSVEAATPSSEQLLADAEQRGRLYGCVATLGEMQRRVVTLRMLDEQPGEDVAELLGLSANHVAVLLMRAKQQLRACMV